MVLEFNEQAKIGNAGDNWTNNHPLHDQESARKALLGQRASDNTILQNHGFPNGDFIDGLKKFLVGDTKSDAFQNDGRDQIRQDVTSHMPADQQKRVHDQEEQYRKEVKESEQKAVYGTSFTPFRYPDLSDDRFKDLKAREDEVNKRAGLERDFNHVMEQSTVKRN